jgi:prepilin-type N-terminal cleavage/methylation domain-containing protein
MKTARSISKGADGFTLVEILVATAAAGVMMAAVITGTITLQRALTANTGTVNAEADQMRLGDYLAKDLRRAQKVKLEADTGGNSKLTIEYPDFYRSNDPAETTDYNLPRDASIQNGEAVYGSTTSPREVRYQIVGSDIRRIENGVGTSIVSDVSSFVLSSFTDRRTSVSYTATFVPRNQPIRASVTRSVSGEVKIRNERRD